MFQEKWPEKYGEVYRIFLGKHCYVVISTPELLEVTNIYSKKFKKSRLGQA